MITLPTQNKEWGFWGTASNYTGKDNMAEIWEATFKIIQDKAGFTPQETLGLMDSRWGRHTADEFAEELSCDLETFIKAFKRKMTKDRLHRDSITMSMRMPTNLPRPHAGMKISLRI